MNKIIQFSIFSQITWKDIEKKNKVPFIGSCLHIFGSKKMIPKVNPWLYYITTIDSPWRSDIWEIGDHGFAAVPFMQLNVFGFLDCFN